MMGLEIVWKAAVGIVTTWLFADKPKTDPRKVGILTFK